MYEVSRFRLPFDVRPGDVLEPKLDPATGVPCPCIPEGAGELLLLHVHRPGGQRMVQCSSLPSSGPASSSWWRVGNLRILLGGETGSAFGPDAGPLLGSQSSSSTLSGLPAWCAWARSPSSLLSRGGRWTSGAWSSCRCRGRAVAVANPSLLSASEAGAEARVDEPGSSIAGAALSTGSCVRVVLGLQEGGTAEGSTDMALSPSPSTPVAASRRSCLLVARPLLLCSSPSASLSGVLACRGSGCSRGENMASTRSVSSENTAARSCCGVYAGMWWVCPSSRGELLLCG